MVSHCFGLIKFTLAMGVFFSFSFSTFTHAATFIVQGGQLTGAQGVLVDGQYLDVSFIDGSCIDVFSGCNNVNDDFFFSTKAGAAAASLALMEQVFIDVGAGQSFDTAPALTAGCESGIRCLVYTAYDLGEFAGLQTFSALLARNYADELLDAADTVSSSVGSFERSFDYGLSDIGTLARWQVSAVPVPAPAFLFLSSLASILLLRARI